MCVEFASPMKTVYQAIQDRMHGLLLKRVPKIWGDDIAISVQTDVVKDELIIDMELVYKNVGVESVIPNISKVIMNNSNLVPYVDNVVNEFSRITHISMYGDTGDN